MNAKKIYKYLFVFMVSLFVLTGCGSDNGGGEFVAPDKVGYLIDSPVANIDYECGGKKAKTNSEGKFECSQLPVTFRVGGIEVGTLDALTADGKVYPQDLAGVGRDNFIDEVIKIAIFLQSLDDDGNIATEITLPTEINSTQVDTLSEMTFDEITEFLTSIGKTPITKEEAIKHLKEQFNMDVTKPVITLNGASIINVTQGTAYTELGATATDDKDGTVTVTISGSVDVNTVGSYTITYKAKDSAGNEATEVTRTVNVTEVALPADVTKPVITLNGASTITLTQGTAYTEAGATATDDRDGNVTVTISGNVDVTKVGSYTITYKAVDGAGNEAIEVTRTVNVVLPPDTTKPVITLNGANPLELTQGTAYNELGATATDDRDGAVTVTISGSVNVSTVGSYTITYKAKDSVGNEAIEVTRTVNVVSNVTNINKVHQKSFSYDSTNRVVKEDLGNGNYIEYIYDDSGNLIQQNVVK